MDRGAWQATEHGVAKGQTWLSNQHFFSKKVNWYNASCLEELPSESGEGEKQDV